MKGAFKVLSKVSGVMHDIGGGALTLMMCLTMVDVIGRAGGHPLMGTFEAVGLLGVLVSGFAIPRTSLNKGHISMDFGPDKLPKKMRDLLAIFTRILCIVLFAFMGFNLFQVAYDFFVAHETTATRQIPLFPFAYAAGVACFVECLVFVYDIIKIREDRYE